jgi:hypothetical protein
LGHAALKPRLLGAHAHLEIALAVARAVEGEAQKIDRLRAFPPPFLRCEPTGMDSGIPDACSVTK